MSDLRDGRIVVTGAAGFIGRHLVRYLRAQGASVDEWDLQGVSHPLDLRDTSRVDLRLRKHSPRAILHLAAAGVQHGAAHDPSCVGNAIQMAACLLDAISRSQARPRLVVAGSMAEYGHVPSPLREDSPCQPTTAYAIGKLAATHYYLSYAQRADVSVCVARLFGVFGPGEAPGRIFPTLLERLRSGQPVPLSDGMQIRDFISVADVVRALASLIFSSHAGVVNVCTGQGVMVKDAARWVARALGADPALLHFGAVARSPGDEDCIIGRPELLKTLIGWQPPQRITAELDLGYLTDEGR